MDYLGTGLYVSRSHGVNRSSLITVIPDHLFESDRNKQVQPIQTLNYRLNIGHRSFASNWIHHSELWQTIGHFPVSNIWPHKLIYFLTKASAKRTNPITTGYLLLWDTMSTLAPSVHPAHLSHAISFGVWKGSQGRFTHTNSFSTYRHTYQSARLSFPALSDIQP